MADGGRSHLCPPQKKPLKRFPGSAHSQDAAVAARIWRVRQAVRRRDNGFDVHLPGFWRINREPQGPAPFKDIRDWNRLRIPSRLTEDVIETWDQPC